MTTLEKLFEKILRAPKEVRYEELQRVLSNIGYVERPGKGSHARFSHAQLPALTIPRRSPVKRVYIMQVKEVLQQHMKT